MNRRGLHSQNEWACRLRNLKGSILGRRLHNRKWIDLSLVRIGSADGVRYGYVYVEGTVVQVDHVCRHLILIHTVPATQTSLTITEDIECESDPGIEQVIVRIDYPRRNSRIAGEQEPWSQRWV